MSHIKNFIQNNTNTTDSALEEYHQHLLDLEEEADADFDALIEADLDKNIELIFAKHNEEQRVWFELGFLS